MKNTTKTSLVMLGLSVLFSTSSFSLPGLINYQGRITDSLGNPITNTVEVTFTLWSAESGGSQLGGTFSDADMVTPDADGIYSTLIGDEAGDQVSASVFENDAVWLNVNVEGEDLLPRTRITPNGVSLYAEIAGTIGGLESADLRKSTEIDANLAIHAGLSEAYHTQVVIPPLGHGGTGNTVSGTDSFVGGGSANTATSSRSTVSGGWTNTANGYNSTVGGGTSNKASNTRSTVSGGSNNTASGSYSTISGGGLNVASGSYSTVAGGRLNDAAGETSTVGGGMKNTASGLRSTISGGANNTASNTRATVSGGNNNVASGSYSTIAGGSKNTAAEIYSTISGGNNNVASGFASAVAGGAENVADGNYSTVAGGRYNEATGNFSFVVGRRAKATHEGSFVFADTTNADFSSSGDNQFSIRASGGILLNGVVQHSSDRNMKEDFTGVSAQEILDKVVDMPITSWRFKSEDESVRHIGPVAQDFIEIFGYGVDDKHITATDADGVALAAIQGLNHKINNELQEKQAEIDRLNNRLQSQEELSKSLEQRLLELERD